MKLYRVCTENKNYPDILDYLDNYFQDGYTVIHANGAWQGVREKSLVIEIVGNISDTRLAIESLAYWLRKYNKQQTVLIQIVDISVEDW